MESSSSRSSAANSPHLLFFLTLQRILYLGGLKLIRDQMSKDHESAFEINSNGELLIIAIAALLVIEVGSVVMFCTLRRCYYSILKYTVACLGCIAPISLMMVVDVSGKKDWKTYADLISYGLFGIIVAFVSTDDGVKKQNKSSYSYSSFTFTGLILVPISLVFVLFVPIKVNWIAYYAVCLSVVVELIGLAYMFFIIFKRDDEEEEEKAQNMEARQQDKNKSDLKAQELMKQDNNSIHSLV